MRKTVNLRIQKWGNSLAVRIPSALAKSAHLTVGQSIELSLHASGVMMTPMRAVRPTLVQKLATFDPEKHGGEAMISESTNQ